MTRRFEENLGLDRPPQGVDWSFTRKSAGHGAMLGAGLSLVQDAFLDKPVQRGTHWRALRQSFTSAAAYALLFGTSFALYRAAQTRSGGVRGSPNDPRSYFMGGMAGAFIPSLAYSIKSKRDVLNFFAG